MVVVGAVANAVVTAFAGACYGFIAWRILRRHPSATATAAFLAGASGLLVLGGARQLAAAFSAFTVDLALWYAATCFAALAIVPLAYVTSLMAWGDLRRARLVGATFLTIVLAGLAAVFLEGADGPLVSEWGTDYQLRSVVAKLILVLFILLPGLGAGTFLVVAGRRLEGATARRATFLGWSCVVYFVVFTADAFGLTGVPLLAARVALAGAALLAYMGYFPRQDLRGADAPASKAG